LFDDDLPELTTEEEVEILYEILTKKKLFIWWLGKVENFSYVWVLLIVKLFTTQENETKNRTRIKNKLRKVS
jgi:hypothetical protein